MLMRSQKPLKLLMLMRDGLKLTGSEPLGFCHYCEEAQGTGGPTGHHRIYGGDSLSLACTLPLPLNVAE